MSHTRTGGAAFMDVHKSDVIATVESKEEAKRIIEAFMQCCQENGQKT